FVEVDAVYGQPGWTPLPVEQFRRRVDELTAGDGWVVERQLLRRPRPGLAPRRPGGVAGPATLDGDAAGGLAHAVADGDAAGALEHQPGAADRPGADRPGQVGHTVGVDPARRLPRALRRPVRRSGVRPPHLRADPFPPGPDAAPGCGDGPDRDR